MAAITPLAAGAKGAGNYGPALDVSAGAVLRLDAAVTAIPSSAAHGANPATLDVWIEASEDGATGWKEIARWPTFTAVGTKRLTLGGFDKYIRIGWESRGAVARKDNVDISPNFTFGVSGDRLP